MKKDLMEHELGGLNKPAKNRWQTRHEANRRLGACIAPPVSLPEFFKHGVATKRLLANAENQLLDGTDEFRYKSASRLIGSAEHLDSPTCRSDTVLHSIISVPIDRFFMTLMWVQKIASESISAKAGGEPKKVGVLQSMCRPGADGILGKVQKMFADMLVNAHHDLHDFVILISHDTPADLAGTWRRARAVVLRLGNIFHGCLFSVSNQHRNINLFSMHACQ